MARGSCDKVASVHAGDGSMHRDKKQLVFKKKKCTGDIITVVEPVQDPGVPGDADGGSEFVGLCPFYVQL